MEEGQEESERPGRSSSVGAPRRASARARVSVRRRPEASSFWAAGSTFWPEPGQQDGSPRGRPSRLSATSTILFGDGAAPGARAQRKSGELASELREARKQRTSMLLTEAGSTVPETEVPAEAYNSVCQLERVCCGLEAQRLPCGLGESGLALRLCHNSADLATRERKLQLLAEQARDEKDAAAGAGAGGLGLPGLEEAGWLRLEEEPRARAALGTEDERVYFDLAAQVFGITFVHKAMGDVEPMMLSFKKSEMPGSTRDVKALLAKLEKLDHVHVVKLIQACESPDWLHLIFEPLAGAGLLPLMCLVQHKALSPQAAARLCQQVASGMAFAQRSGLGLLDWSIWNVMSVSYGSLFPVRLFGVGLAGVVHAVRRSDVPEDARLRRGAFCYSSPELCRFRLDPAVSDAPFKKLDSSLKGPTDVWGLGAVVYTALSGHPPFGGSDEVEVMQSNMNAGGPSFGEAFVDVELAGLELLEHMLLKEPKGRPELEAIISSPWVTGHVRSVANKEEVARVVERLRSFAKLKPAMRAVGRVLALALRPEKLHALEDTFHTLDVKGDGELEPSELTAFFADRGAEMREIFTVLDVNGSQGLSLNEFVFANIFGEDVLTERMLLRTFELLDMDGTGEITALELYSVLRKYEKDMTPEMVADFMGDLDRDWDEDIDFDEFRGFFPNVRCQSQQMMERRSRASELLSICQETFDGFLDDCGRWRDSALQLTQRAVNARDLALTDESSSRHREWSREMSNVVKQLAMQIRQPPTLEIRPEAMATLSKYVSNVTPLAGSKARAPAGDSFQAGALLLNGFFTLNRPRWQKRITAMLNQAQVLEVETNRHRKRSDAVALLDDFEGFGRELIEGLDAFLSEQENLLEASEPEAMLPKLPFARRGMLSSDVLDEEAMAQIARFKKDRARLLDAEKEKQKELELRQSENIRTTLDGERRGLAWQARRAARAERKRQERRQSFGG